MATKKQVFIATCIISITLVVGACSTTDSDSQRAEVPVDKDGLPILTQEQEDEGIVCVRVPVTGSRISKKSCSTKEQRERIQAESQRQAQDVQRRSTSPTIQE